MCAGGGGEKVMAGERLRLHDQPKFRENRQGAGVRTHLASPATVAAAAVMGEISDPRPLIRSIGGV